MVGEFELDDLISTGHSVLGGREGFLIVFLILSVFFGNIVLMNVFTGLAVGDVALAMSEELDEILTPRFLLRLIRAFRSLRREYARLRDR